MSMIAKLVLDKKREGHALGTSEIREFVEGFTKGDIPDYQMSALAMAICCRGMTAREDALALARALVDGAKAAGRKSSAPEARDIILERVE